MYWQELFTLFPNIRIDVVTLTANAERIVAEIDVGGSQKSKVGNSPGQEKEFQVRGAFVYEFSDNMKIKEIRMYYDSDIMKKQLDTAGNNQIVSLYYEENFEFTINPFHFTIEFKAVNSGELNI